jgi:hypothetical protein
MNMALRYEALLLGRFEQHPQSLRHEPLDQRCSRRLRTGDASLSAGEAGRIIVLQSGDLLDEGCGERARGCRGAPDDGRRVVGEMDGECSGRVCALAHYPARPASARPAGRGAFECPVARPRHAQAAEELNWAAAPLGSLVPSSSTAPVDGGEKHCGDRADVKYFPRLRTVSPEMHPIRPCLFGGAVFFAAESN